MNEKYDESDNDRSGERPWKTWVTKTIDSQIDPKTGKLTGYFATLSDVTSIKMAEEYQKELTVQAIENKRQQENFIDISSHEMRNPMSAVLQSAEGIALQAQEYISKEGKLDSFDAQGVLESAQTILLCVSHQTRIIEDILTVSKLDAMLLTVVPVEIRAHDVIERALKMFDDELKSKDILLQYEIDISYKELAVDVVLVDPARLTQVLVNLVTNGTCNSLCSKFC